MANKIDEYMHLLMKTKDKHLHKIEKMILADLEEDIKNPLCDESIINLISDDLHELTDIAIGFHFEDLSRFILKHYPHAVKKISYDKETFVHSIARGNSKSLCLEIIDNYPEYLTLLDEEGNTMLHICAGYNRTKSCLRAMKRYPHLARIQNSHGETFLHVAAEAENETICKEARFLSEEKCLMLTNANGDTFMHICARNKMYDVCKINIPFIPKVAAAQNKSGDTLFHIIAQTNEVDTLLEAIILNPEWAEIKNNAHKTFVDIKKANGDKMIEYACQNRHELFSSFQDRILDDSDYEGEIIEHDDTNTTTK